MKQTKAFHLVKKGSAESALKKDWTLLGTGGKLVLFW
jgi:hypothetical protein